MSCLELCCQCCCCKSEDPTSKYPHIEYKSLGDATRAVPVQKTDFQTTPLQNIFGSSQNHAEYTVHHEVTESAITAQPTSMNEDSPVRRPKKRFTTQVTYPNLLLPGQSPKSPAKRISLPSGPSPLADGIESSFIRQSPTKHQLLPFEFPIIEQTEVFPEEAGTYSTLQFSIFYDVQQSRLQIHLLKAIKLKLPHGPQSSPRRQQPSVLVVMHLYPHGEDIFSSQPMPWSPSTDFNQLFEFKGLAVDGARSQSLVFRIYKGTKPSQANFVGSVVLPLGEADLFGVITTMRIDETGANLPVSSLYNCIVFTLWAHISVQYSIVEHLYQWDLSSITRCPYLILRIDTIRGFFQSDRGKCPEYWC